MNNHKDRAHALLSASSAHRWLECPPSAVAAELYEDTSSEYADEGTRAHEVAEAVASGRIKAVNVETNADTGVDAEMVECAEAYLAYINEQKKSEDAFVILEQRVDFSEYVPDGFGTCDCLIIQDGVLTVIDYKYGQGVAVSATGNPQMRLYALGALNDYGYVMDVDTVEMHIFQPRINNISVDTISVDELTTWGESVKPVAAQAYNGEGEYKAGSHCKFCPHAGRCKALHYSCVEFIETHNARVAVPVLTPEEVADVLDYVPILNLWINRVKDYAMGSLLDGKEIPRYKLVAGRQGNRKWSDDTAVAEALTNAGYQIEEITETKLLSPAGMDKAIGKKKVSELLDNLIERAPGPPTIAHAEDKRPAYDKVAEAVKDFE